jgi:hypothetical protein
LIYGQRLDQRGANTPLFDASQTKIAPPISATLDGTIDANAVHIQMVTDRGHGFLALSARTSFADCRKYFETVKRLSQLASAEKRASATPAPKIMVGHASFGSALGKTAAMAPECSRSNVAMNHFA